MTAAAERPTQTPDDFLMGGGVPSAAFHNIGDGVSGVIVDPPPFLQQQRDYTTGELKVWEDGNPMMQLVVTLQTDERDDKIEDDDGRRRIYVKANMKRAVADAVRKAKAKALEVGGTLSVTYSKNGEASKKGMQPPKVYEANYAPPGEAFLDDNRDEEPAEVWTWPQAVKNAKDAGIPEAMLKAEMKKSGFSKMDVDATAFIKAMCKNAGAPLSDDEIPF